MEPRSLCSPWTIITRLVTSKKKLYVISTNYLFFTVDNDYTTTTETPQTTTETPQITTEVTLTTAQQSEQNKDEKKNTKLGKKFFEIDNHEDLEPYFNKLDAILE